jgi:hypothetical protein
MVTSVAKGWVRQDGDPRPMLARYQSVCEELARLGGSPIVPANEVNIQSMQSAIIELTRRKMTAGWDEALARASGEFADTVQRYRERYNQIIESQRRLPRTDPVYQLLGLIGPEVLKPPMAPQDVAERPDRPPSPLR